MTGIDLIFSKKLVIYFFLSLLVIFLISNAPSASAAKRSGCQTPECKYYKAETQYNKLLKNAKHKNRRDKWIECINKFKDVYKTEPKGVWAPAGLFMTGKLYKNLYKYSRKKSDLKNAVEYLGRTSEFKKSKYSLEAIKILNTLPKQKTVVKQKTVKKKKQTPPRTSKAPTSSKATVKAIRFGSLPTRTRIVIDTNNPVRYKHGLLRRGGSNNKYQRLYIDLKNSTLGKAVIPEVSIDDERVKGLRSARKSADTIRIVVDIKTYKDYKIFSLRHPSRVVIDVWGKSSSIIVEESDTHDAPSINSIINSNDLAKQLQLGVKRIIIDPGHGGADRGAPGYLKGVYEKDIVLSISKKLAKKIKKELGCEVIMTRSNDTFISLDKRTEIANRKKADLFISIHTNASRDKRAYGIETYFLNLAKDRASVSVAARENATSEKNISDLQTILNSLMRNTKINESSKLAKDVQNSLYRNMKKKYGYIKNKGVKQAPFYVLLGARMPSILVETSFISNKRECKRLTSAAYQDRLCDSIVKGIKTYIKEIDPKP